MVETLTSLTDYTGRLQFEAMLEQVYGIASIYGGVQQDAQDLLDLCGGGEIVLWSFDPASTLPSLAIVRQGSHYFVWIAGTVNIQQWVGNVTGTIATTPIGPAGYAQGFFWRVARTLLAVGQRYLPPNTPDLKITLAGHSLGGACAFALWLQTRALYPAAKVEVFQLCAPKLLTKGIPNPSPAVHCRLRVLGDPVPMLPPDPSQLGLFSTWLGVVGFLSAGLGWSHYGDGYQLSTAGVLAPDLPGSFWSRFVDQWLLNAKPSNHLIANVASFIEAGIEDPYPITPRGRRVADRLRGVIERPPQANQAIPFDPAGSVDPAQSNQTYFGSPQGPITQANADSAQSLSVLVTSSQFRAGSNIQGLVGASMSASGLWKLTAILRGENYGKSTSVAYQGVPDITKAVTPARKWAKMLATTMGNGGAPGSLENGPTDRSPRITHIRITDCKNPRIGMLLELDKTDFGFNGPPGGTINDNSADFTATALSMRMTGFTTDNAKNQGYSNHAILYPPDSVVVEGSVIDLNHVDGNGNVYSKLIQIYQQYLADPSRSLGFTMIDPGQLKKPCKLFAFVNGVWQATCTAHGYGDGDRVRLTSSNAKGFNGTYKVNVVDANTIQFNSGPPGAIAAPTIGKVQRVQTADGVKLVVFAQFSLVPAQLVAPFGLRVSKRNPGKIFTPVSFKKRARRLH